ncbi:MAG: amidohydrolase family protein [Oscillospiraceae bacterium]
MYEIVFENGLIVDTVSKTSKIANLAINNGKIAEISCKSMSAARTIDASGLVLSPGFIDVHSHLDGDEYGAMLSCRQGITTYVGGNCGLSPINIGEFLSKMRNKGSLLNIAMLIGHSFSMRRSAGITDVNARATQGQLVQMQEMARKALDDGAYGISLGLDYAPGTALTEIDAMANLCAESGTILPVHTRLFTQNDLYSIYEILSSAKRSGVRLLMSHFVYQYSGFGTMQPALEIMDEARAKGMDVWMDSGMYSDWATYVGTATFDMQTILDNSLRFGSMVTATGKYTGQRLNKDLYDLLRDKYPDESIICFSGSPDEVSDTLLRPYAMPSTDSGAYRRREGHPQISGSYPKYIRKLVREKGLLSLEEAIYKATLMPATVFGFSTKGVLREGYDADIIAFSLDKIQDNARFPGEGMPDAIPDGIPYVMINGSLAVDNNNFLHTKSGEIMQK